MRHIILSVAVLAVGLTVADAAMAKGKGGGKCHSHRCSPCHKVCHKPCYTPCYKPCYKPCHEPVYCEPVYCETPVCYEIDPCWQPCYSKFYSCKIYYHPVKCCYYK